MQGLMFLFPQVPFQEGVGGARRTDSSAADFLVGVGQPP